MGRHALPVEHDRVHGRRSAVRSEVAATPRPVARSSRRAEAHSRHAASRSLARRLDRVVTTPVVESVANVRRTIGAKRFALILVPTLALTSGIALASPANAAVPAARTVAADHSQRFTVAGDVTIPVSTDGATTTEIVSYPTLVTSGGASIADASTAIGSALSAGGDRAKILSTALEYLGDTYVEGGASHSGIDCSGLTMLAYASVGIQLAHYVPTQDAVATTIPESEALPGDLVVYDNEDHIGLYLGDGLVLQAPHPGEPVDIIPMFSAAHHFARLLPAS
jgi:peptidoglycan DL-endopeptidase RipA